MKSKSRISISSKHQQQKPIISTKSNSGNQKRNRNRNPYFQQNQTHKNEIENAEKNSYRKLQTQN
jgi:hypothetical protein